MHTFNCTINANNNGNHHKNFIFHIKKKELIKIKEFKLNILENILKKKNTTYSRKHQVLSCVRSKDIRLYITIIVMLGYCH